MSIDIEQLSLQLPAGFEQRAPRIARLLAQALAQQLQESLPGALQPGPAAGAQPQAIAQLRLAPHQVQAGHSDQAIARQLASSVAQALAARLATLAAPAAPPGAPPGAVPPGAAHPASPPPAPRS